MSKTNGKVDQVLEPAFPASFNLKIIGLGGVGSIVAEYAALWLAAMSKRFTDSNMRIVLIDGDEYEDENERMYFGKVGNKAQVKCDELIVRLEGRMERLVITAEKDYVSDKNIGRFIHEGDYVMMCVDSHAARKLVSEHFEKHISDGTLISAGNDGAGEDSAGVERRGTYGNCQVYLRRGGVDVTPSLTKFHPEIANPPDKLRSELSCIELAAAGVPQLLFANFWAAGTALASLYLTLCGDDAVKYGELAFDFAEGKVMPIDLPMPMRTVKRTA